MGEGCQEGFSEEVALSQALTELEGMRQTAGAKALKPAQHGLFCGQRLGRGLSQAK